MNIKLSLLVAAFSAWSSSAFAGTLSVEPSSPNFVPESFDYRYDPMRKWPGCQRFDILYRHWYDRTWQYSAAFTSVDGVYEADYKRTWAHDFCRAETGLYNYVQLVWTDPSDASRVYHGVVQVDARGTADHAEVTCGLTNLDNPGYEIECDMAVVKLPEHGDVTIKVNLVGLE